MLNSIKIYYKPLFINFKQYFIPLSSLNSFYLKVLFQFIILKNLLNYLFLIILFKVLKSNYFFDIFILNLFFITLFLT